MSKKFSELSLAQKILEGLCLAVLAGMLLGPLLCWNRIPDQIPGHYNAAGVIDRWGGKGELFILPVVAILLYGFLTFWIAVLQHGWVRRGAFPSSACCWLEGIKLSMLADFAVIEWGMAAARPLGAWFTPVSVGVPGLLVVGFIVSMIRFAVGQAGKRRT